MPQTTIIQYTIPAAGTIKPLVNTQMEFFGNPATMTFYASAGASGDTMHLAVFGPSGPLEMIPPGPILVGSGAAATVKTNENFVGQFAIPGSSRLDLTITGAVGHTGLLQFVVG